MELMKSSFLSAHVAKSNDVPLIVSDLAVARDSVLQCCQFECVPEYTDTKKKHSSLQKTEDIVFIRTKQKYQHLQVVTAKHSVWWSVHITVTAATNHKLCNCSEGRFPVNLKPKIKDHMILDSLHSIGKFLVILCKKHTHHLSWAFMECYYCDSHTVNKTERDSALAFLYFYMITSLIKMHYFKIISFTATSESIAVSTVLHLLPGHLIKGIYLCTSYWLL